MALIAGISGVRFTIDEPIEKIAAQYTRAFSTKFTSYEDVKIIVGRDSRAAGRRINKAVIKTLKKAGCQPIDLGIVPTPTLTMNLVKLRASGGIMITASHNPAQWNGLKFFGKDGLYLRKISR